MLCVQMSELFNQRSSVEGKIPSGLFNACFDLDSGAWAQDAAATKCLAMDGYFISLFDLRLDRRPLALADRVLRDAPAAWDPAAIARFVSVSFVLRTVQGNQRRRSGQVRTWFFFCWLCVSSFFAYSIVFGVFTIEPQFFHETVSYSYREEEGVAWKSPVHQCHLSVSSGNGCEVVLSRCDDDGGKFPLGMIPTGNDYVPNETQAANSKFTPKNTNRSRPLFRKMENPVHNARRRRRRRLSRYIPAVSWDDVGVTMLVRTHAKDRTEFWMPAERRR